MVAAPFSGEQEDGTAGRRLRPSGTLVQNAHSYCVRRGLTEAQIAQYKVSVTPMVNRVFFPHWKGDTLDYWMGRSIDGSDPKTLDPGAGYPKPLFGLHVRSWTDGPLFVVEGVFDHMVTPNSIALMGSFMSEHQRRSIVELNPPWVGLILDPDALSKSYRIAQSLREAGVRAVPIHLNCSEDPNELGRERMTALVDDLREAKPPSRLVHFSVSV